MPIVTTKLIVQYPALGDRAARVFYSTNQEAPQNLSIWGGLLRKSQDYVFYSSAEAGAFGPGHNQSFIHKLEEINE